MSTTVYGHRNGLVFAQEAERIEATTRENKEVRALVDDGGMRRVWRYRFLTAAEASAACVRYCGLGAVKAQNAMERAEADFKRAVAQRERIIAGGAL